MAGRIQIEPDRQEIAALPQRYASAADRSDGVALAALFSPEGTLTIHDDPGALGPPSRSLAGRDAIASSVGTLRDRFEATFHMLGQQTARIDGDGANGETYCVAHHYYRRGGVRWDRVLVIRYHDRFERVDGRWRFASRRLGVIAEDHQQVGAPP